LFAASAEPETLEWFQVQRGDTVVDVGAHIGRYTLTAAKRASNVIAIEPEPSNFALLETNTRLNRFRNVTLIRMATSNRKGRIALYLADRGDTGTSSLEANWSSETMESGARKALEVDCDTLDNIMAARRISKVDWLKIDVEGHEVPTLEGAGLILRHTSHLIIEVSGGNERACEALTRAAGLEIVRVEVLGVRTANWLLGRSEDPRGPQARVSNGPSNVLQLLDG
jgi:FkbM family methyltransferase